MKSLWFLVHQWKEWARSSMWQKSLVANIFIALLLMLMFSYILVLGLLIDKILEDAFPDEDPLGLFNSILFYFFIAGLLIRYLLQPLPTLNVESYIHLPIKRNTLVNYLIFKSVGNVFNIAPLLLFVPFAIKVVIPVHGPVAGISWLIAVLFMVLANNFLLTYFKRQLASKAYISLIIAVVIIAIVILDYFAIWSLLDASRVFFELIVKSPVFVVMPFAWVVLTYLFNFNFLKSSLYPEKVNNRKAVRVDRFTGTRYFESLGLTGEIITLEIKLWLRHKRTKSMIYLLPLFILYGLFFYPNPTYEDVWGFLIFVGVFISGGMMMNYINYAFGYESNYFDTILTKEIDMKKYLRAKLLIGIMVSAFCYVVTIPYVFFGWHVLLINTATFLFNIGVVSYVLLYMATYNKKRMDLSKGSTFNYQGIGAMNWLAVLPAFLMPVLIFIPFGLFGARYQGLAIISLLGIIGLLLMKRILKGIYNNLKERKYVMAEGFRD